MIIKQLFKVLKFYINYEECKWVTILPLLLLSSSFILTMRNVNLSKCAGYEGIEDRFILTMRNVNFCGEKL